MASTQPTIIENPIQKKRPYNRKPDREICGAKTKKGTPCQQNPMRNGRCRLHGGATPRGIASANFIHGKYAQGLPEHLVKTYDASINDPELLSLDHEIALIDARITELVGMLSSDAETAVFKSLQNSWLDFEGAIAQGDADGQRDSLRIIGDLIKSAGDNLETWGSINTLVDTRRKLVESQRKRNQEIGNFMSATQAMTLIGAVLGIIKRNVTDDVTLRKISNDINDLIT